MSQNISINSPNFCIGLNLKIFVKQIRKVVYILLKYDTRINKYQRKYMGEIKLKSTQR